MKAVLVLGAFLLAAVLAVAGFVAFIRFGASRSDPDAEAHLTREVTAEVVASERRSDRRFTPNAGYQLEVRYEVDGQWYATDGWVPALRWQPPRSTVSVCTEPDDPAAVAIPSIADRVVECGEGYLGRNGEQRAEPTTAP